MTYGLTSTGFNRKTHTTILADIKARLRELVSSNLVLTDDTVEGALILSAAEHLDQGWEALQAAAGALDPDNAVDHLLTGVCKLTGVTRTAAQTGSVSVNLTFDGSCDVEAGGLLLGVNGQASNLWSNDTAISEVEAGTVAYAFTSTIAASEAVASAGTLTVIATPKTGLTLAMNPLDATPGRNVEELDALRLRREASLATRGKGTVAAIRAELIGAGTETDPGVEGILDAHVSENSTNETVDGVPPRTVHVIVWDGPGEVADDDELAQAVYDSKGAARPTYGAESGNAEDPYGDTKIISFTRATELAAEILITVVGGTETSVKAALLAAHNEILGADLLAAALVVAAMAVDGVTNVTTLLLGFTVPPTASEDLAADIDEVITLDTSRIGVTVT
jgi:hypothetical protein